jgi:D-alanyl-lipoteichoic acid acyltransferase DltB (MBOAT superfamily)
MAISYTIDVYKRKFENYPSSINFFAYLSFFPHLLAGPIDRGRLLIPQFEGEKTFDYRVASDGVRQIIWGLFKKIVIADGCAGLVNVVWSNFEQQNSLVLLVTAVFYSIQIYSDFSGYSDIAIGTAHLFGINLMKNFGYPYFSRNVSEFWRKWHISLTSWFTEYIYIPLGGNRRGKLRTILNTLIVFSICGLWHGANWNFVFWGFLNGLLFIPLLLQKSPQKYKGVPIKLCFSDSSKMVLTFLVITFCWIFFRAPDLNQAFSYCFSIFANYECPLMFPQIEGLRFLMLILIVFIVVEWKNREFNHGLESLAQLNITYRWGIYLLCLLLIFVMRKTASSFIYFSF